MIRTMFLFLAVPGLVAADCFPRRRVVVTAPAVVVKKEVAVVTPLLVPIAVYAPVAAYGAVYTPPTVAPTGPAAGAIGTSDLQKIIDALVAIDSRLKALEGTAVRPPKEPKPVPKAPESIPKGPDPFNPGKLPAPAVEAKPDASAFQRLAVLKCAGCHEQAVSADKGKGFTLLEKGVLSKLGDRQARRLVTMAYTGKMPPTKSGVAALTDEEVATIVAYVDGLK